MRWAWVAKMYIHVGRVNSQRRYRHFLRLAQRLDTSKGSAQGIDIVSCDGTAARYHLRQALGCLTDVLYETGPVGSTACWLPAVCIQWRPACAWCSCLAYRAQLADFVPPPALPVPANPGSRDVYVLSFGAGQESTALLYLYLHDTNFRIRFVPRRLVAVTADTGNEHPATLLHLAFVRRLCKRHGVEFHYLDAGGDYHSDKLGVSNIPA